MKSFPFTTAVLLACSLLFVQCAPEEMSPPDALTRGDWSVNYYFAQQDKTANYTGYTFSFRTDGTVACESSTGSYVGTWQITRMVEGDHLKFEITSQQAELSELNASWSITSMHRQAIDLKAGVNKLVLQKL